MWKNIRRRRTRNPTWTEYVHLMVSITKDQHIHPIQFSWRPLSIQELCEWNQWKKKARRMEESWKVFRWKLIPSLLFFCFSCERQFNWKWNLSMTRMFIYTGQLHWLTWWILEDIWSLINNRLGSGREGRRTSSRSQKQTNMDLWHLNISHLSGCTYCHLWPLSKWFWRKFIVIAHESHVGSFFFYDRLRSSSSATVGKSDHFTARLHYSSTFLILHPFRCDCWDVVFSWGHRRGKTTRKS